MILDNKKERKLGAKGANAAENNKSINSTINDVKEKKYSIPLFFMFKGTPTEIDLRWDFSTVDLERKIIKTYCWGFISLLKMFWNIFLTIGFPYFIYMNMMGWVSIKFYFYFFFAFFGYFCLKILLFFVDWFLFGIQLCLIYLFNFLKYIFFYLINVYIFKKKDVNFIFFSSNNFITNFTDRLVILKFFFLQIVQKIFIQNILLEYFFYYLFLNGIRLQVISCYIVLFCKKYFYTIYWYLLSSLWQIFSLVCLLLFFSIYFIFVFIFIFFFVFYYIISDVGVKQNFKFYFNLNFNHVIGYSLNLLGWKFILFKKLYIYWNMEKYLNLFLKYLIKFLVFLYFLFKLIFFFYKPRLFVDRFVFWAWDEDFDPDIVYTEWRVDYTFTKYYAERKYFSFAGYIDWQLYILQYKIMIPLSYYLHLLEWKIDLYEIYTFSFVEYTDFEQMFFDIFYFLDYYLFSPKSYRHLKYIFYDFLSFVWFFIIEDLFLYTMQFGIIFKWLWNHISIFGNKLLKSYKPFKSYFFFICWYFLFNFSFIHNFLNFLKNIFFLSKYNYKRTYQLKYKIFNLYFWLTTFYWLGCYFGLAFLILIAKLKKFVYNVYRVKKFLSFKTYLTSSRKFKIFYDYFFMKSFIFFRTKFRFKVTEQIQYIYFIDIVETFKYYDLLDSLKDPDLCIDAIVAKNQIKDDFYLFFKRFFIFVNIDKIVKFIAEKRKFYAYIGVIWTAYKTTPYFKDLEDITWYDTLTGGDAIYKRISAINERYEALKKERKKKRIRNFQRKKNLYFYLLKNKHLYKDKNKTKLKKKLN